MLEVRDRIRNTPCHTLRRHPPSIQSWWVAGGAPWWRIAYVTYDVGSEA